MLESPHGGTLPPLSPSSSGHPDAGRAALTPSPGAAASETFALTGTHDDILARLARAEHERALQELPRKSKAARALISAFIVAGRAIAVAGRALPADRFGAIHDRIIQGLVGDHLHGPDDGENLRRAAELLAGLQGGKTPALFCLTSHPLVNDEETHLGVEMMRHAIWALRRLRARPCRPQVVAAVDPYALDTFSLPMEGIYAGFMAHYHVGFDRQEHLRGPLERLLLGEASWDTVSFRIASALAEGRELVLALGGGVPTTGRVYYAAREFLTRLYKDRPARASSAELAARHSGDREFSDFLGSEEVLGALRKSARRMEESWVIAKLTSAGGASAALGRVDQGELPDEAREALRSCAKALGYSDEDAKARLDAFAEEFAHETPYRENLFRFIVSRVVARGTPILLLPLRHDAPPPQRLIFGAPCALVGARRARGGPLVRVRHPGGREEELAVPDFARGFVRSRFP